VLSVLTLLGLGGACRPASGAGQVGEGGSGGQAGAGGVSHGGSGSGGKSDSGGRTAGGALAGGAPAGGAGDGGSSATGGAFGTGGASGTSTLATFASVHDVVFTLCGGSGCHEPDNTPPALLVDDAKLYSTLLSYVSSYCGNRVLVKPGSPQDSAFYLAQAAQCGDSLPQMPLGCVDACTPPDYLEGIRQWIENGAPQN